MSTKKIRIVALAVFGFCLAAMTAEAIPAWARKYSTSCATCHVAYPKLNSFGEAFRANGYRMPAGDEDLTTIKDVPMGSEAWKRLWPNGIWPGAIPGPPQSAIQFPFGSNRWTRLFFNSTTTMLPSAAIARS